MSNREIGMPMIVGYLGAWWGGVAMLFILVTSNNAPPPPELAWESDKPLTTTKIALKMPEFPVDADGDSVDYTYAWTRNGEPMPAKTGTSVPGRETMSGEVWEVSVTPNDGTMDSWGCYLPWRECAEVGKNVAKLSITVANSPPRARVVFVDDKGVEFADDEAPVRKDIHLALSCFDPDVADRKRAAAADAQAAPTPPPPAEGAVPAAPPVDPCTYKVSWWKADEEPEEGAVSEFIEPMLPGRVTKLDESWKVVVIANDGEDDGEPVEETIKIVK